MIELNTRYTFTPPTGIVSTEGIHLIAALINRQDMRLDWHRLNPDWLGSFLPSLPDEFEFVWVNSDGKLTTRVRKHYYQQHGLKCPDAFITELGNIARAHTEDGKVYYFDFVNRFDWRAGDYGDRGSCYWGSNAMARDVLEENGGLAMRFYNEDGYSQARAWVMPIEDYHVVFNGYGFMGDSTLIIARVLSFFLGQTYRYITLVNNDRSDGLVWINGSSGYAVGPADIVYGLRKIDLELPTVEERCYNCGEGLVHEDDVYYGPDHMAYCEECYYERFETCYWCGEPQYRETVRLVDGDYYCDYCRDRYAVTCEDCGNEVLRSNAIRHKQGFRCLDCAAAAQQGAG